jgi:hypothetical protein
MADPKDNSLLGSCLKVKIRSGVLHELKGGIKPPVGGGLREFLGRALL